MLSEERRATLFPIAIGGLGNPHVRAVGAPLLLGRFGANDEELGREPAATETDGENKSP